MTSDVSQVCNSIEVVMEATVSVKGQVVMPAQNRRLLGVKQGTRLPVEEHDGAII